MRATVRGLKPGKYSLAIHAFGDLSQGEARAPARPRLLPTGARRRQEHGAAIQPARGWVRASRRPAVSPTPRRRVPRRLTRAPRSGYGHLADFEVGEGDKEATIASQDAVVSITGPESIIGRSVVVIETPVPPEADPADGGEVPDDAAEEAQGAADGVDEPEGERVAAGVIGVARMVAQTPPE